MQCVPGIKTHLMSHFKSAALLLQILYLLFVEVDSVVVHSTSITTTSRMLPVLTCEG